MTQIKQQLFNAFREDHAVLGGSLNELGERLRATDVEGAKLAVEHVSKVAGAHIAFEEHDFYPALDISVAYRT